MAAIDQVRVDGGEPVDGSNQPLSDSLNQVLFDSWGQNGLHKSLGYF